MIVPPLPGLFARRLAIALGVGWIALVVVLSLMPSPPRMPTGLNWDKVQHALAYAFLIWWWMQALEGLHPGRLVVALALFGIAIELLQALTPYRSFELADMVANGVGIGVGLLVCRTPLGRTLAMIARLLPGQRKRPAEPGV